MSSETATFAAGCFWGVEHAFRKIDGVLETQVGYTGGHQADPDYRTVCGGRTGHAEAVEVTFDPTKVSYEQLLEAFFEMHDPTQLNRQGPDVGDQYRSAIFVHGEEQERKAGEFKEKLDKSGRYSRPVVTAVLKSSQFYRAEEYHQRYIEKKGIEACH